MQSLPDPSARHMDINQLTARHGFDPADRDRVVRWATAAGLQVTGEDAATRRVMLRGSAEQLSRAFEVDLERFGWQLPDGRNVEYRGHAGPVHLPAHLDRVVEGVFGLDDRPAGTLARAWARRRSRPRCSRTTHPQLASLYDFPRLANGGEGVELVAAMIELGGVVHPFDLAASFARLGLPAPDITNVWLDGATPTPDPNGADVEVALDYQVIGGMVAAMAPKAHLTIVSYNAPNSERGFIDAAATAASDAMRRPAAVSISWGAPEDHWSPQGMRGLDAAFAAGALHGVTFSAAAGDAGSTNDEVDGYQHPEFPASSPHAWACGGTTLLAARGRIRTETVWNELARGAGAAGSGVSSVFPVPAYQAALGIRPRSADGGALGRGLPDGSGNADPLTGWNVVALRRLRSTGGTSAVAPDVHGALDARVRAAGAPDRAAAPGALRPARTGLQRRDLRRYRRPVPCGARLGPGQRVGQSRRPADRPRPRRPCAGSRCPPAADRARRAGDRLSSGTEQGGRARGEGHGPAVGAEHLGGADRQAPAAMHDLGACLERAAVPCHRAKEVHLDVHRCHPLTLGEGGLGGEGQREIREQHDEAALRPPERCGQPARSAASRRSPPRASPRSA